MGGKIHFGIFDLLCHFSFLRDEKEKKQTFSANPNLKSVKAQ